MQPTSVTFHAPNGWQTENQGTHALEVLAWNPEESHKPTLICVHGLTRNAHDFAFIAPALTEHYRVYALSMAGRGNSAWLDDKLNYHYGTYVQDCLAFITRLGMAQVTWLGTSMGGIIGMTIASMMPQLITKLVINDIGAHIPASALQAIYAYASVEHVFDTRAEAQDYFRTVLQPWGVPEGAWEHLFTHSIRERFDGKFTPMCDPDILEAVRVASENFTKADDVDLSAVWEKVACPVLLLHGADSTILPTAIADAMATRDNVTLHRFAGIGHAPALMDAAQIGVVTGWLEA